MNKKRHFGFLSIALIVLSSNAFGATNLNNSNADTVALKTQCGTAGDCAESMYDLITWIWGTRHPTALAPLLVNIGPGTFINVNPSTGLGNILCNGGGYVTFRGAGRGTTTIMGPGVPYTIGTLTSESAVVEIKNCSQLSFENMTIKADLSVEDAAFAVGWIGGGSSTWSNIELIASYYPWVDKCLTGSSAVGSHTWFGTSFTSNGTGVLNVAFRSDCGVSQIYGSQLLATKSSFNGNWSLLGVEAGALGQVELYGTSVKAIVPANADPGIVFSNQEIANPPQYGQGGLLAIDGGVIHMHGGIVSVRHERDDANSSVFGARTIGSGSMIHTPDTAYGMKAGANGVIARIMTSGGMVMAPFQWPEGSTPPNITSANGADTFVETDCSSSGACVSIPANQQEPHLMIYNLNCVTNGPWFDSTMHQCRI